MAGPHPARANLFISTPDPYATGSRVAVKDIIDVRGMVTTAGSRVLPDESATRDATVVARARAADATVVGKTNLDEWAFDTTGANPHYGVVVNPHDVPGPLARDVASAAAALEIMAGTSPTPTPRSGSYRVAVPAGWVTGLDAAVGESWSAVAGQLPEIAFPARERFFGPFEVIVFAEAARQHRERLATRPDGYGAGTREALRLGLDIPAVDYIAALDERARLVDEVDAALDGWDAVLLPGTSCVAPRHEDTDGRERVGRFTAPFSLTGHPVVTVPAPVRGDLPVGMQVVGRRGGDTTAVAVAAELEHAWQAFAMHDRAHDRVHD